MEANILILIALIVMSCEVKQNNENNVEGESYQKVYIYDLSFSGEKLGRNTAYLEQIFSPEFYSYKYKVDNHKDSSNLYYQIQKTNDSTIYFFDEPCKRLESKIYKVNNEDYEVTSYFYDVENSIDEEATMYINKTLDYC